MTDPFSVVAGVVGIVGVALSNTRQVYDFISGIKGAPETVTTLSGDLDSLANILQQLSDLTKDPSQALFIVPLKGSLERCIAALRQLELSIKPYVEGLQNGSSKWKRFAWNFKEKEVAALQIRLGSCRENLQLAILLGVMTQQATGSKDIRENFQNLQRTAEGDRWSVAGSAVPSSGPQGSDYGFALKRFLLEHESELGSQHGDAPLPEEAIEEPSAGPSNGAFMLAPGMRPDVISPSVQALEQLTPSTTSSLRDVRESPILDLAPGWTPPRDPPHPADVTRARPKDSREERIIQGRIIEEILADGWLEGINMENLTEQEQEELSERIAEAYRQKCKKAGFILPPAKTERNPQIREVSPLSHAADNENLTNPANERTEESKQAFVRGVSWEAYLKDVPTGTLDIEATARGRRGAISRGFSSYPIELDGTRQEEEYQGPLYEQGKDHDEAETRLRPALLPTLGIATLAFEVQYQTVTVEEIRVRDGDEFVDNFLNCLQRVEEALQPLRVVLALPQPDPSWENDELIALWNTLMEEVSILNEQFEQIPDQMEQDLLPPDGYARYISTLEEVKKTGREGSARMSKTNDALQQKRELLEILVKVLGTAVP